MDDITIGYFGIPGRTGGKTHLVKDGDPACGMRLHPKHKYEWCGGWENFEPECERCKKKKAELQKAIAATFPKKKKKTP